MVLRDNTMGTGLSDNIKTEIRQLINQRANEIVKEDPLISDKNAIGKAAIEIREFIESVLYLNSKRR